MSTHIEKFDFQVSNLDWVPVVGNADYVVGAWYGKHTAHHSDPDKVVSQLLGCLRMTCRAESPSTDNYWSLTKTWEQLGIPSGAIVQTVTMEYRYRWALGSRSGANRASTATFDDYTTKVGPAELCDHHGERLLVLCPNEDWAPVRNEKSGMWIGYPASSWDAPLVYPYGDNWGRMDGGGLDDPSVPPEASASNTTVEFRIWNKLPALGKPQHGLWVRLKVDQIYITIGYESTEGTPSTMLVMFSD